MKQCWFLSILLLLLASFLSDSFSQLSAENLKPRKLEVAKKTKLVGETAGSYNYRSQQSGDWNDKNTWQWDNDGWRPALAPPGVDAISVEIMAEHIVTVTTDESIVETTVDSGGTLKVNRVLGLTLNGYLYVDGMLQIVSGNVMTNGYYVDLGGTGTIIESDPFEVLGMLTVARTCSLGTLAAFGNIGLELTATGTAPYYTSVTRITGEPLPEGGESRIDRGMNPSSKTPPVSRTAKLFATGGPANALTRYFQISPDVNSGLAATVVFHYQDSDLNGATESWLQLYSSTDGGYSWSSIGGGVNASANTITVSGINSFSLLAAGSTVLPPSLTNVSPAAGSRGSTLNVTLTGSNFGFGANTVGFSGIGITVNSVSVNSSTQIVANITISSSAPIGPRDVSVTTGFGTATLSGGFSVGNPSPELTGVLPTNGVRGQSLPITLQGTGFVDGVTSVSFGDSITVSSVTVLSPISLTAQIAIGRGASLGTRSVSVTNSAPGGGTATLPSGFTVNNPVPTLSSVLPVSGVRGTTLSVTLQGTGFFSGVTSISFGDSIAVSSVTVVNPTTLTAQLTIAAGAVLGVRGIAVTNSVPGGGTSTFPASFTVANPAPTVISVAPTSSLSGQTLSLTLMGTNFFAGQTSVSLGAGITVNSTTVNSRTQLSLTISISSAATGGLRDVTITNAAPGGGSATLAGGFTVTNPSPTLTSLSATTGVRGKKVGLLVTGTGFVPVATSISFGSGVTVTSLIVSNPTQLFVDLSIALDAALGSRNVTVTNASPGGGTHTLASAFEVVNPIPTLTAISPTSGMLGETLNDTLTGADFLVGASTVSFGSGITVNSATVNGAGTQIVANITIAPGAAPGPRNVTVANPGAPGVTKTAAFTIKSPGPTVTSIAPTTGGLGQTLNLIVTGTNFYSGITSVSMVPGIAVNTVTVNSLTQITVNITIAPGATVGARDVVVSNGSAGGGTSTLPAAFSVVYPAPTIVGVSPPAAVSGQTVTLTITGTSFVPGQTSVTAGAGITVNAITVNNPTQMSAAVSISSLAIGGIRDVTVTNPLPGGGTAVLPGGFTINNPVPTITSVVPGVGARGKVTNVAIAGSNFIPGVTSALPAPGLTLVSVTFVSATQITGSFFVARNAALGFRDMTITNGGPGGGTATLAGAFEVQNPSPSVLGVFPNTGDIGQVLGVVVTGTDFLNGVSSISFGAGVSAGALTIDSTGTRLTTNITIAAGASAGPRSVTVTNSGPGGGSASLAPGFTVNNPLPTISSVTPSSANRGSVLNITVTGSQFISGVTTLNFGADIVVNSSVVKSSTEIQANISVSLSAASGTRPVTVTSASPGGGSASLPAGFTVGTGTATLVEETMGSAPDHFVLQEAYPNPFNPSTRIRFGLPEPSRIKLDVHNMLGNVVAELINGERGRGFYELQWHAENLPSGVYLIRMYAESLESSKRFITSRKAVFVK